MPHVAESVKLLSGRNGKCVDLPKGPSGLQVTLPEAAPFTTHAYGR